MGANWEHIPAARGSLCGEVGAWLVGKRKLKMDVSGFKGAEGP